jgi:4'-phosphopantetheinyl transferase
MTGSTALWAMPAGLECAPWVDRWSSLLDEDERARAAGFVFPLHRRAFVAGHALVRVMLGRVLNRPPESLRFERDEKGRPELAGLDGPSFSLSHTDRVVACAVSDSGVVGVDVEGDGGRVDIHGIAERFFAPGEAQAVRDRGAGAFTRIWTLKEAFLKATGEGLRRPLDSFQFSLDPVALEKGGAGEAWSFAQMRLSATHWAAVALRGAPQPARPLNLAYRACRPEELL